VSSGENLALLTDLYQLTMAQTYLQSRKMEPATFSLFIRTYPRNRSYFVSAGLRDVLDFLGDFSFDAAAIDYLKSTRLFTEEFLDFLKGLRFTGEVWAIPEGRLFFKDEPILEVTAPMIEAQIVETFIINQINLQSLIASKAARCVYAARGRVVVDFSLRRTQGIDAGMKVARASYLAGFSGTSNVRAGPWPILLSRVSRERSTLFALLLRAFLIIQFCLSIPTTPSPPRTKSSCSPGKWPRAVDAFRACASTAAISSNWPEKCGRYSTRRE
jgi:nicotinic acid phosphoribosyltransferase